VMEMCLDNPREEFSDLFATHPPIEQRIQAIIKFAGGHDPGPLALSDQSLPDQAAPDQAPAPNDEPQAVPAGPWSAGQASGVPGQAVRGAAAGLLPGRAPGPPGDGNPTADEPGPWGPHNRN
jgi:heat shock protein HtpX